MKNLTLALLMLVLLCSANVYSLPKLNSYPSASATIFLDFDGETVISGGWNGGAAIFAAAPQLSDAQVTEIFNRVSEDYRPFNINITTDSTVFINAPIANRIRVIITPTSAWKPNVGGVSYIGSFTWGDDTPAFVFSDKLGPNNAKYIAECCSHESGHAVGLSHQSTYDDNCNLTETYNTGTGSGETGWAPLMGNSYYRNMTGWNNGPTPYGCANVQDNLTIITSQNGFTYRTDDYAETMDGNTASINRSGMVVDGLISTSTDKDAFRITLSNNGNFHLEATPYSIANNDGANLDIKIALYNISKQLIATYDPADKMSVTIDTTLNAGSYYILIDGTGNANTSSYGSLGSYKITGVAGPLPIRNVSLSGNLYETRHNLRWNIVADEAIKTQEVEYAEDAVNFKPLTTVNAAIETFSYVPNNADVLYYRVKVTTVLNQVAYSNIISLKAAQVKTKPFLVSTFVQNQLSIQATEDFQYRLRDSNGRLVKTGNGTKGSNTLNLDNASAGLYIIQLFSTNNKQVERIIKQ